MKAKFAACVAGVAALLLLTGSSCDGQPVVCATYQDEQGQWREEDGEPVDSDPCDTDDLHETKPKPTKKPTTRKR